MPLKKPKLPGFVPPRKGPVPMPKRAYGGNPKHVGFTRLPDGTRGVRVKPAGIAYLEYLAREAGDYMSMASALGISEVTLRGCRKRQHEVQAAIDHGRSNLSTEIKSGVLEHFRNGNWQCGMFLAKTILGLRETGPTDPNAVAAGPTVNITLNAPMTDAEFERLTSGDNARLINPPPLITEGKDE